MPEKITTRIAVGLSMLVALFGLLAWDHWSGHAWGLAALTLLMTTWGGREIAKLFRAAGAPANKWLIMGFTALLIITRSIGEELHIPKLIELEPAILVAFAFFLLFPPLTGAPSREVFLGIAATSFGFFYVWYLGSYVIRLRYLPGLGESAAYYGILVAKGSDITAYFTGKALGRTKLIPVISPGKTVAGFVGGLVGAVLITVAFCLWTPLGTVVPLKLSAPIGIILGLVAVAGDLVESLFKRSAELKDSARLLPTFGGILDVTDSIQTAGPATFWLIYLLREVS
ncbi:MAG TPA: phosphatidate cytidylyltransferase [Planctomycetota bacterium]|nr:phosphatidate cytidylyltransferase [Planctomycetota bacterium]